MTAVSPHPCPPALRTAIVITVGMSTLEMVRCRACEAQWWERDGAPVALPEVLPLLKDTRKGPRAPARTLHREVDLTDDAQESSLLFRQLLAFQEAAVRKST